MNIPGIKKFSLKQPEQSVKNVSPVEIGIVLTIILLIYWQFRGNFGFGGGSSLVPPAGVNPNVPSDPYLPSDLRGWTDVQFNPLGANGVSRLATYSGQSD